jgi:predicted deacetylase
MVPLDVSTSVADRGGGPSLLVSIHDVSPKFEAQIDRLVTLVTRRMDVPRFAMLVVPDHWGDAPIVPGSAFATRLRNWAEQGVEMFLHGWYHRDEARHGSAADRFRARHMTAGEGEFLGLDRQTAARRMRDGKTLLEDVLGRPVAGFVAPAWLYGPGALAAAKDCGFALLEDHMRVWSPVSGEVLCRGPVITWASRSRARIASSLAVAAAARTLLPRRRGMRLAVHPGDTGVPPLVASIDRTIGALARGGRFGRYADLLPRAA